ncbi:MAG: hypothetical protein HFP77_06645 [Methylococcales symbiont of Iophon sp. n. MRB-2018]|nr:MAG: hypothetical protein HFP77_06645 [Methylococcales symbiont of Iophon sp. n. MRB-2018]KAF3979681.1 MAG: hypothetical protein HFP76_06015 [Methylococcales symbiont of Iophon sp. n. MRB-2018]
MDIDSVGHTVFSMVAGDDREYQYCHLIYHYQNNRGENDPRSEPLTLLLFKF